MKKVLILLSCVLIAAPVYARDQIGNYSIRDAMSLGKTKATLGSSIKFYFGKQRHGKVIKNYGEFGTNKKTNAFNKTDKEACQWVFLSAMVSLRDRAVREGGNAVVDIKSNYKGHLTSSTKTFRCGAGTFVAGVALVGTVVKIR